jgi:hypothetical protein
MHDELSNIWLFARALAKVLLVTGLGPGILIAVYVEKFYVVKKALNA